MDKDPIEEFIESLPFFKKFSASEKVKLVNTSGIFEKFKEGEVIISEGKLSAAVFVILTGKIEI